MVQTQKPRVVFETPVIANYRVPFFAALAKEVDLLVIASEGKKVDGLHDVYTDLPFKNLQLQARLEGGIIHSEILRAIDEHHADIFISWSTSLVPLLAQKSMYAILKSRGIQIGWMGCDGYMYQHFPLELLLSLVNPRHTLRTLQRILSLSRVDFFISYSSHTAAYLHQMLFVPKQKIHIAHNAIDTSALTQVYREFAARHAPKQAERVAFAGRMTTRKGLPILLQAFATVLKTHPQAQLRIIGEGSERPVIETLAHSLGLTPAVTFLGPIYDDTALAEELYTASLFVLPGIGGLGMNTAMALGLPIIHTHADGTEKDMIHEGENGWYFDGTSKDLAKKINEALADPERLLRMGALSEKLVTETFTLENMVQSYAKAIQSVCSGT